MARKTTFITCEGDTVFVGKLTKPARVEYAERSWWAFTRGRNPDVEVAGPCWTRAELYRHLKALAAEGSGEYRLKRRAK